MGSLLGSGQRHIETPWVVQEADALVFIGSHTRENDEVLLSALECIHTGNFHLLQQDKRRMRILDRNTSITEDFCQQLLRF